MEQTSPSEITNFALGNLVEYRQLVTFLTPGATHKESSPVNAAQEKLKDMGHSQLGKVGAFHVDCRESTW